MKANSYRDRVYQHYASVFRGESLEFSLTRADSWGRAFSSYLAGWLPGDRDARMLDLGCGDGKLLHLLKTLGYGRTRGVDISTEQVNLARQVTSDIVQQDVLEFLRTNQEKYEVVFAFDIIEHLSKDEVFEFLDGCADSLTDGGWIILSTPNAASPMFGYSRYGDFTHEVCFSPSCLRQTLLLFGFRRVEFREVKPYSHGIRSAIRSVLWSLLRLGLLAWNLIEIGHDGGGVFTRNFLTRAQLRQEDALPRPRGRRE